MGAQRSCLTAWSYAEVSMRFCWSVLLLIRMSWLRVLVSNVQGTVLFLNIVVRPYGPRV